MQSVRTLDTLDIDEQATVLELRCVGSIRRRFLDIGLTTGAVVTCIGRSPLGDPSAYLIRGAVIAIRRADAKRIVLKH